MARLLVSIRALSEADAALRGGADMLDVKEPARGSLGRADSDVVATVLDRYYRTIPVSAAMGELDCTPIEPPCPGLAYVKWGLSGWGDNPAWQSVLTNIRMTLLGCCPECQLVPVAYADWRRAAAPAPEEILCFACSAGCGAMLIDTWQKDGSTLLDWMSLSDAARIVEKCKASRITVALAGSLGPDQIKALMPLDVDWFAVRGAACHESARGNTICEERVRTLADLVQG